MEQEKRNGKKSLITAILAIVGVILIALFAGIMLRQTQENSLKIGASNGYGVENNDEEQTVQKGKVIIQYLDESGEEIMASDTIEGNLGTEYTTTRKHKDHYISNGFEPLNKIGEYAEEDITVKYIYKHVVDAFSVEQEDDIVTLKVQNLKQDIEYKLILEQKSEGGDNLTGGKFYLKDQSNPDDRIAATTVQGRALLGAVNVANEEDTDLVLSEFEAPNGYEYALSHGSALIHLDRSFNSQTNKYEIAATSEDTDVEVVQDDENFEIILKVKNKLREGYEIATKQFVKSVDGVQTDRNVAAGVSRRGKIEYTEEGETVTVKTGEVLKYTIRVYNEENQDIDGQVVTQVLPDGLKYVDSTFNQSQGWSVSEGNLTSNKLVGTTIGGINPSIETEVKYGELELELVVDENEAGSATVLTNTASVPIDRRERNRANNTDDETVNLTSTEDIYDLAIYKFATKINNEATGRSVTAKLNEYNQLEYEVVDDESEIKDLDTILYTIRVYNEGNQDLNGTKVTDVIPQGLQLVENSTINTQNGWTANGNNVETTILENRTIQGFLPYRGELPHYEELQIELKLDEDAVAADADTIVNKVLLMPAENETDTLDNVEEDELALARTAKTYNIALKKFASTIDEGDTSRGVEVSVNTNKEIVYTESNAEKTVQHGQKVVYTIRVYNEGNTLATLKKITDTVPQGLKFVEYTEGDNSINDTYGWTKNGNNVETNFLNGQTIQATNLKRGETPRYLEVKVEFEVDEDVIEDGVETIVNRASIEAIENETKTTDNQDDDTLNVLRSEEPDPETHDITVKKFVDSINDVKQNKEVTAKVNEHEQIVYTNDDIKTNVNLRDIVVFTIRMFNTGNQPMEGKTITDVIPEGLAFIEDNQTNIDFGWQVENGVATTNYIVGQTIPGFEKVNNAVPSYVDVQIVCKVTGTNSRANDELVNLGRMEPSENDDNPDDNEDRVTVVLIPEKQKVSDLSMQKFLYSVDGEVLTDREIVAKNINGKIVYTKNDEIYKVSNNQKLVYTLRVYNVGDGDTLGRIVVEDLPQGLDFVKDSEINTANNWKMYKKDNNGEYVETEDIKGATILQSDKLTTETINGFEIENNQTPQYKDVLVELIVNEDEVETTDRIVTNNANLVKDPEEPDNDNDKSSEKVQVKMFDLNVTKYIKEITIVNSDGEDKTVLGIEKKGKIVKKEVHAKKVDETQVFVTYGLKVDNFGEIAGYATQLTDYVPKNFELENSDAVWKLDGKKITTDILADKLIEPGESKTVEVTFKWSLKGTELGERNNIAYITDSTNDYKAKDRIPDRDNEEKFIISIKTGATQTYIALVIGGLTIIALIIRIKLKRKKD